MPDVITSATIVDAITKVRFSYAAGGLIPTIIPGESLTDTEQAIVDAFSDVIFRHAAGGLIPQSISSITAVQSTPATYWNEYRRAVIYHFNSETFSDNPDAGEIAPDDFDPDDFQPTNIDIDQWLDSADTLDADIVFLTTQHQDGFALWPSVATDHNISTGTWYNSQGFNIVERFCMRARARGFKVGLYLTCQDNHWETANPGFTTEDLTTYFVARITELLNGDYGTIDMIWFDSFGTHRTDVPYVTIRAAVKDLQPNCIIMDNAIELHSRSEVIMRETITTGVTSILDDAPSPALMGTSIWQPLGAETTSQYFWHLNTSGELRIDAAARLMLPERWVCQKRGFMHSINLPPTKYGLISNEVNDAVEMMIPATIDQIIAEDTFELNTGEVVTTYALVQEAGHTHVSATDNVTDWIRAETSSADIGIVINPDGQASAKVLTGYTYCFQNVTPPSANYGAEALIRFHTLEETAHCGVLIRGLASGGAITRMIEAYYRRDSSDNDYFAIAWFNAGGHTFPGHEIQILPAGLITVNSSLLIQLSMRSNGKPLASLFIDGKLYAQLTALDTDDVGVTEAGQPGLFLVNTAGNNSDTTGLYFSHFRSFTLG